MDPTNPRVLYASMWNFRRTPYSLESGGPGSGLWKSTDGGDHWTELTRNPGLPKGTLGIIGVTVSPVQPGQPLRHRRGRGGRRLPLARRRQDLDEDQRRPRAPPARLVLQPHLRRPQGRGGGLRPQRPASTAPRTAARRFTADPHAARRQPRPLDRPRRPAADDRVERRRRQRLDRRRRDLDRRRTTSRRPSSTASRPTPTSPTGSSARSRTTRRCASSPRGQRRRHRPARLGADGRRRERLHRGRPEGPRRRLRRLLRRPAHPRSTTRRGEVRDVNPWPDNPMGCGAADLKYRFQWNFPIAFSPNDPNTLYAAAKSSSRRTDGGQSWTAISPGPDAQRQVQAGPLRRPDHQGQHQRRVLRHDLLPSPSRRWSRA